MPGLLCMNGVTITADGASFTVKAGKWKWTMAPSIIENRWRTVPIRAQQYPAMIVLTRRPAGFGSLITELEEHAGVTAGFPAGSRALSVTLAACFPPLIQTSAIRAALPV